MVSHGLTKDRERKKNRKVYYSWVLEELTHSIPQGPLWGGQSRLQAEREKSQDLGFMPLLGSMEGRLWVFGLRLDQSIQTKKSRVLVSFPEVLSKGYKRGRPWEAKGTIDYKGCWENHIRTFHLLVTLQAGK